MRHHSTGRPAGHAWGCRPAPRPHQFINPMTYHAWMAWPGTLTSCLVSLFYSALLPVCFFPTLCFNPLISLFFSLPLSCFIIPALLFCLPELSRSASRPYSGPIFFVTLSRLVSPALVGLVPYIEHTCPFLLTIAFLVSTYHCTHHGYALSCDFGGFGIAQNFLDSQRLSAACFSHCALEQISPSYQDPGFLQQHAPQAAYTTLLPAALTPSQFRALREGITAIQGGRSSGGIHQNFLCP